MDRKELLLYSIGAFTAGMRSSILSQQRIRTDQLAQLFILLGIKKTSAAALARIWVQGEWFVLYLGLLVASVSVLLRNYGFYTSDASGLLILTIISCNSAMWLIIDTRTVLLHRKLLSLLSYYSTVGIRTGYSISFTIVWLIVAGRIMHLDDLTTHYQLYQTFGMALLVLTAIAVWLPITLSVPFNCMVISINVVTMVWSIAHWLWIYMPEQAFKALNIMVMFIGILVCALAYIVTFVAAFMLGVHRLAPRDVIVHVKAGLSSATCLAVGWLLFSVLDHLAYTRQYAPYALLMLIFVSVMILRVRFARLSSLESLGCALFMARDAQLNPRVITHHYRINWFVLSAPSIGGGVLLLALARLAYGIILLLTLYVLEDAIEEIIVQRRTSIVPAELIHTVGYHGLSGLGAACCLAMICSASGITGVTSVLDIRHSSTSILLASALLLVIACVLHWLRNTEYTEWYKYIELSKGGMHD